MKNKEFKPIRLNLVMLAITFGIHTLIEIILSTNSILSTNILYKETIFPDIFIILQSLLDVAVMSAGLSIIAAAFFMGHKKTTYILIYIGAVIYRRLLATAITLLISEVAMEDILISCTYLALDMLILGIALIIIELFARNYKRRSAISSSASSLFSDKIEKPNISAVYPFTKIYGKDNPLQGCLLVLSVLLSAVNIIAHTVELIQVCISKPDNMWTVVGIYSATYAVDLIIIVISYAIPCLLLSVLYSQNEKRKAMYLLYKKD